jgi:hypothetical protein
MLHSHFGKPPVYRPFLQFESRCRKYILNDVFSKWAEAILLIPGFNVRTSLYKPSSLLSRECIVFRYGNCIIFFNDSFIQTTSPVLPRTKECRYPPVPGSFEDIDLGLFFFADDLKSCVDLVKSFTQRVAILLAHALQSKYLEKSR